MISAPPAFARIARLLAVAVLPLGLVGGFPARSGAQATRVIAGSVTDDSAGVHGVGNVEVSIPALGLSTRTTWMGEYRIPNVPPGRYIVVARLVGYANAIDSVALGTADVRLDFVLAKRAVTLDSLVTRVAAEPYLSPNLRGFYERMAAHSTGVFIPDSVFRSNDTKSLADLLTSHMAGMRVQQVDGGAGFAISSRSDSYDQSCGIFTVCKTRSDGKTSLPDLCYATVFIDGAVIYDGSRMAQGTAPPNLNDLGAQNFAAAEFYPPGGTLPAKFHNPNACGTLVLWTREK